MTDLLPFKTTVTVMQLNITLPSTSYIGGGVMLELMLK